MVLTIVDRGVLFDASQQPSSGRVACFTSLCVLRSGRLLCGFQNGPQKNAATSTIGICRSDDDGRSWTLLATDLNTRIDGVPGSLSAGEMVEVEPGKLLLCATWFDRSDPLRPLFDAETEGILRSRQLLAVSTDDGATWSPWRELYVGELRGCSLTGPVLRWNDGTIAIPFESFKEYDDPRPARHAAWLIVSRDGGETFAPPIQVAQHPEHSVYYWDQRLCIGREPDSLTALFWTHDLIRKQDLNVHVRHAKLRANGLQMSPIQATSIPGQIAAPVYLQDGRLLAFVVDRSRPGTMTLWCSHDEGATWSAAERVVVYQHDEQAALTQGARDIDFCAYWEDMGKWTFGHPACRCLADGRLLLAWYAGSPQCMSIHWARVHVE